MINVNVIFMMLHISSFNVCWIQTQLLPKNEGFYTGRLPLNDLFSMCQPLPVAQQCFFTVLG